MRFLFALLALVCAIVPTFATSKFTDSQYEFLFSKWVAQHSKVYAQSEFFERFHIFKTNLDIIHNHNLGDHSSRMAANEFADLTGAEFKAKYLGYKPVDRSYLRSKNTPAKDMKHLHQKQLPTALDWTTKGVVTPIKNQGQCGSCWSFSATGSVEGAVAIATGSLISLSEQQLMDCSSAEGNEGCNGGLMDYAFQYIITNGGICSEAQYPYLGVDVTCVTNCTKMSDISGFTDLTAESQFLGAINIGPVSIAIEADQAVFQFYAGGVINSSTCGTNLDHGVLIVGYGTDTGASGLNYYKVKNSWGAAWGEAGYVRLVRDQNMCGLALDGSYPTGATLVK